MKRVLRVSILMVLITGLAGCSLFGSGKKDGEDGSLSEADLNAQREGRFGSGSIPTAEGEGIFRDVHFAYDSASIDDTARQDIEYNAEVLRSNPDLKVQLEGHCDERGTAEYNLALGQSRAKAVFEVLKSFGIQGSRFNIISYGEEVPLDPGHGEEAWARNRRVHFSGYAENSTR